MFALYVTRITTKGGKVCTCLKSYNKIVTFDLVIILSITGLSYHELINLDKDIILIERSTNG